MKKLIATTLILAATSAGASELKVNSTKFSGGEFGIEPIIELNVTNTTSKEIVAFKGTIKCTDAFGDEAIKMGVKARSANIPAGKTDSVAWKANMFSKVGNIILNNDAKNFECSLIDLKVVN